MATAWSLITAPTRSPITAEDAMLHCRIDAAEDRASVESWITTAIAHVEHDSRQRLLTQTWDVSLDALPEGRDSLDLEWGPLQSVTHLKYYPSAAGAQQTWSSTNYLVDASSRFGRIGLTDAGTWPTDLRLFQPITIRVVLGWTTAALVPVSLLHAVRLLVAHYAQQREPTQPSQRYEVPLAYLSLLDRVPVIT